MDQINTSTNALTNIPVILEDAGLLPSLVRPSHIEQLCSWGLTHLSPTRIFNDFGYNPTLTRDLALTVTAGIVFMHVCTYSNGWFLPVLTYIIAVAALFATIQRHSHQPVHKVWFHGINVLGCAGLVSALWLSSKMALMF